MPTPEEEDVLAAAEGILDAAAVRDAALALLIDANYPADLASELIDSGTVAMIGAAHLLLRHLQDQHTPDTRKDTT